MYRDSNYVAIRMMWEHDHVTMRSIPFDQYYERVTQQIASVNSQKEPVKKGFMEIIFDRVSELNIIDFKTKIDSMITIFGLSTFCHLFNHVVTTDDDLKYECLDNLCDNVCTIMESDDMLKIIERCTIIYIVSCSKINLDEETLFEFVAEWIKINNVKDTESILSKIRFGTMNSKYLSTVVYQTKLITIFKFGTIFKN